MYFTIKILAVLYFMMSTILFDFNAKAEVDAWRVVKDAVMGGLSEGEFSINLDGHGFFRGSVSLANNGGFVSVRHRFETQETENFSRFRIRLKGDGKPYQFRVKADASLPYSYIANIETSGDWETFTIPFSDMYPAYRGRLLDLPNFSGAKMAEIAFLIGNKKEETFALEIDYIKLQ